MNADAFIDAILASPDDDAPRLVYADALTEQGDPRGEFITVQCARARLEREGKRGTPAHFELLGRERALEPDRWLPPKLGALRGKSCEWTYQRGFITELRVNGDGKRKAAWPHLARVPLERVRIDNSGRLGFDVLVQSTVHPSVKTVEAHATKGVATFDAKRLALALREGAKKTGWWGKPLPEPGVLSALVAIHMSNADRKSIEQLRALPEIAEVGIFGTQRLDPEHFVPIVELPRLRTLRVSVGDRHAIALLKAAPSPSLRILGLAAKRKADDGPFGANVLAALAASPMLPQLTELDGDFRLDEALVGVLEKCPALTSLRVHSHTPAGIDALHRSTLGRQLEELGLTGSLGVFVNDPVPALGPELARLRTLRLRCLKIDDDAARKLVTDLAHVPDLRDAQIMNYGPNAKDILRAKWPGATLE